MHPPWSSGVGFDSQSVVHGNPVLPQFDAAGDVTMRDMLVDFAPYLYRGRMTGYLTRLSATGLANVTSGGGQVPAFVVSE
jgi:hypothetical protein